MSIWVQDPVTAEAVRFIREHADRPISVEDVLADVPISRRSLETRFRASIGRPPGEEIRRVHVERAKTLLRETELPMPDVADRSGFLSAKSLSDVFTRVVGMPPTDYRRHKRRR